MQMENPVGPGRRFGAVGDHEQILASLARQAIEQRQHALAGFFVEIARRLIGQHQQRVVDQGPGNGDTLLLAAREAVGECLAPIEQTDGVEQRLGRRPAPGAAACPSSSSGSVTFSITVSVGIRLKNWKTKPMLRRRNRVRSRLVMAVKLRSPIHTRRCPAGRCR